MSFEQVEPRALDPELFEQPLLLRFQNEHHIPASLVNELVLLIFQSDELFLNGRAPEGFLGVLLFTLHAAAASNDGNHAVRNCFEGTLCRRALLVDTLHALVQDDPIVVFLELVGGLRLGDLETLVYLALLLRLVVKQSLSQIV